MWMIILALLQIALPLLLKLLESLLKIKSLTAAQRQRLGPLAKAVTDLGSRLKALGVRPDE